MKQLLKGAALFLPFVLLIMAVNWYGDPANVLRTGYEKQVASLMVSGENAANLRNMDDRQFMKTYAAMRTQPIDTLVLGSSHSMQITKELTGDENTFCAGVTGADLRDCISIYRLFRDEGFTPQRVILVIDCWFFSDGTLESRAMTDGYVEFCKEYGFTPLKSSNADQFWANLEKKGQIFSIPYFQTSLDYLRKGLQNDRDPVATQEFYSVTDMRRADGSYCYNEALRDVQPDTTFDRAVDYIIAKPAFAVNFNGVSDQLVQQLTAFIASMQADGVEVALMLPPFHPDYYAYMETQTDSYMQILATEPLTRQIAEELGVPLFGSYNPTVCNLTAMDFYDGLHCSDTAMYQFYPTDLFA